MAESADSLEAALYISTLVTGLVGIITVAPLLTEMYLLHALDRVKAGITTEGLLAGFSAVNGLIAFELYSTPEHTDPFLPATLATLTFLAMALMLELGGSHEVRRNQPE
ncbi:hypothetical protein [Thermococcus sp.]|uniref:hypothetical protein n=1 Tax=Thermococcus sp. TaxID=35749 RepID=UPI00260D745E|nr:hypothetical protein [Thermococcus sp.]